MARSGAYLDLSTIDATLTIGPAARHGLAPTQKAPSRRGSTGSTPARTPPSKPYQQQRRGSIPNDHMITVNQQRQGHNPAEEPQARSTTSPASVPQVDQVQNVAFLRVATIQRVKDRLSKRSTSLTTLAAMERKSQ